MIGLEYLIIGPYWLALNIYYEARDQSEKGQIAVAHVVMNRVEIKNVSIKDIVLAPYQFSWVNTNDPQKFKPLDLQAFEIALVNAAKCKAQRDQGYDLHGATHYYNPLVADPVWAHMPDDYPLVVVIDEHHFHKGAF